ncbi:MAG TPA: imidazole glycerol phosphate synthase subunit HisH [Vicinamibacteria bacterium]|nr:imidazole glycerol phosphate synthase subunit HisH [Vicinamibacteria bacterium]
MIAIADYGIGNLGSVTKGFRRAGAEVLLTGDPSALRGADALVLPGDGAFGATMSEVERRGLVPVLREAVELGKPLLGICIGMQLLFEESEEHGRHRGLGFLPGRVRRFEGDLPVPHMGWNRLRARRPHPVLDGVPDGAHVYFVHSYYCDAPDDVVVGTADYGRDFAAIVAKGSVLGVQFHPEKSQEVGLRMVASFVRLVDATRRRPLEMSSHTEGAT